MANRRSIKNRAKQVEVKIQQRLAPGSEFAGGAKRPALEDEDIRFTLPNGKEVWGEVKNYSQETIRLKGGPWKVLSDAYNQVNEAINRNKHCWQTEIRPIPFAVLYPKGVRNDYGILCMVAMDETVVVVPINHFETLLSVM